jgi:predicted nuclease with TOPRIM domain
MDKIIDGVDVSKCKQYRAEIENKMPYGEYEIQRDKCYSGIEIIQDCKGNKGCIYKQLKRLQAENEKLKKENDILRQYRGSKQASYEEMQKCWQISEQARRKLEKENNKLKTENEKLIDQNFKISQKYTELEQENERLKFQLDNAPLGVLDTYKKALQEIREIADIIANANCYPVKEAQKIIDKINSVIGAE